MSSGFSGSVPPPVLRAGLQASLNDVLVRLVNLPQSLQNNPSPTRLTGTVTGQNPDGSLNVQTDRGVVTLLLKDRQNLPPGQVLEIDIPAGRPPAQAALRPASPPAQQTNPNLTAQLPQSPQTQNGNNPLAAAQANVALRVDRTTSNPQQVQEIITNALTQSVQSGDVPPTTLLQLQQAVRLNMVKGGETVTPTPLSTPNTPPQDIIISILRNIVQLPDSEINLKMETLRFLIQSGFPIQALLEENPDGQILRPQIQNLLQNIDTKPQSNFTTPRPLPLNLQFVDARVMGILPSATPSPSLNQTPPSLQLNTPLNTPIQIAPYTPNAGTPMVGQVVGFTAKNFPVIQFVSPQLSSPANPIQAPQLAVIQFPTANVNAGSMVFLNITPAATPNMPTTLSGWVNTLTWPDLQEVLHTAQILSPTSLASFNQILPSTTQPQNLGALALFVLNVLRSGDVEQMFPQPLINMLRQGMKVDQLRAPLDSSMLTRLESMALPNEWRASMFPLWHDHQLHKLPIYWKRMEDDDKKDRDKRQKLMRFLFDLKLSRMGEVQVDGFFQQKRLDMILRTKQPLSVPMQNTMRIGYAKAMERSSLTGELGFQFRADQWVTIDMPLEMA